MPKTIPSHKCLVPDCPIRILKPKFMCRAHWSRVPRSIQKQIWQLYDTARGSPEHIDAIRRAVRHVTGGHVHA